MKRKRTSAIYGFVTLAVLTVIFFGVRVFQIVWDVDRITGNLQSGAVNGIIVPLTLLLVLVTGLVFYILSPDKKVDTSVMHSIPLGAASIFFAAAAVADGILEYREARDRLAQMKQTLEGQMASALQSSRQFVVGINLVAMIFSIATAVYFVLLACTYFNKNERRYHAPYLGLSLPLWFGLRLAGDYIELTNSPVLTETIYDTLTLSAIAVFMMAHVRLLSDVKRKNTVRSNFAFGFMSILLSVVFPLPRYFMAGAFDYSVTSSSFLFNLVNFAAAVYILVFLICLEKKNNGIELRQISSVPDSGSEIQEMNGQA